MSETIEFKIDGRKIVAEEGKTIVEAAKINGVYIPTLCNFEGAKPKGCCRMCTIKVNNRFMTACTIPGAAGMEVESNSEELNDIRKGIVELLFVTGNHFCPSCEKSGNCELQALAYRYQMMVPRFPYVFPQKGIDASSPKIIKDQNRCILCQRCMKTIKDEKGRNYFAYQNRGSKLAVVLDEKMGKEMSDELAALAMENCPVGSIIYKENGFKKPIGKRKYDKRPIGNEIEA
ncbi:MAG: 2Fe-2S iron-sulfur cluster-binding protein [Bacteroidales bacterium]|nr:2Fe-2S iron-sulfur cluster-binding protein [Bacteroidales bacterium]